MIQDQRSSLMTYIRLEKLFEELSKQKGLTKQRLLLSIGIDPSQYRSYRRNDRPLSAEMILRLATMQYAGLTPTVLRAWQVIDLYSEDALNIAAEIFKTKNTEIGNLVWQDKSIEQNS